MALTNKIRRKKISKKQAKALKKAEVLQAVRDAERPVEAPKVVVKKDINISSEVGVKELSDILEVPVTAVIRALLDNGVLATLNERVDYDSAAIAAHELGFNPHLKQDVADVETQRKPMHERKGSVERSAIVTVMGHVDHGKTTLLDALRKTRVAQGESGGITQHIGAYQIQVPTKSGADVALTFIDTPGHEAFAQMRAHGANVTDVVVLVIAADEGVKPQTEEAIQHARAAHVPIIVAATKMDTPGANLERLKQELGKLGLNPEDWGGDTVVIPISAKQGSGLDTLLEYIHLVASMRSRPVNPKRPGLGVILEAQMSPGKGPIATVIVQDGHFRAGDVITAAKSYGKIRFMENDAGNRIDEALPGMPVLIAGLTSVPAVGDQITVVETTDDARVSVDRAMGPHTRRIGSDAIGGTGVTCILKADVGGSLPALKSAIRGVSGERPVMYVLEGVGPISESDVNIAIASDALVIGFRCGITKAATQLAQLHNISIIESDIIYDIVSQVKDILAAPIGPKTLGKAKILKVFRYKNGKGIIGALVEEGQLRTGSVQVEREGEGIGTLTISTLQIGPEKVTAVSAGSEGGAGIENASVEPLAGDMLVVREKIRSADAGDTRE